MARPDTRLHTTTHPHLSTYSGALEKLVQSHQTSLSESSNQTPVSTLKHLKIPTSEPHIQNHHHRATTIARRLPHHNSSHHLHHPPTATPSQPTKLRSAFGFFRYKNYSGLKINMFVIAVSSFFFRGKTSIIKKTLKYD